MIKNPVKKEKPKKKKKARIEKDGKYYTARGKELTRCSNTMTEAQFFSWILSNARRLTLRWKPRGDCLLEARRPYKGPNKRQQWEYNCSICNGWFSAKEVEADHIVPCGGIKSFDGIQGWYERALVEKEGFRVLCKECHYIITFGD